MHTAPYIPTVVACNLEAMEIRLAEALEVIQEARKEMAGGSWTAARGHALLAEEPIKDAATLLEAISAVARAGWRK